MRGDDKPSFSSEHDGLSSPTNSSQTLPACIAHYYEDFLYIVLVWQEGQLEQMVSFVSNHAQVAAKGQYASSWTNSTSLNVNGVLLKIGGYRAQLSIDRG